MVHTSQDKTKHYRPDDGLTADGDEFPHQESVVAPLAFRLTVAEAGGRLDAVLAARLPDVSRNRVKALIEAGDVEVDGQARAPRYSVRGDEAVTVAVKPREANAAILPEPRDLPIVFEDAHVLVLNKPAGWVVHPGAGNWQGTLQNFLLAHHAGAAGLVRAGIVHRLDKDTSGLMMVAKTEAAQQALTQMIAARAVTREYLALVRGAIERPGTVDAAIGRHATDRTRMAVTRSEAGRPAVTHYQPIAALPRHTLMRCKLETGRTHQIRVHMAHIKHPIEGDPVYAPRYIGPHVDAVAAFARQALHATRLAFAHPVTDKPLKFDAPPPADFARLQAELSQ
jgi:23S rRNA pseudouridine1911/1915/1917 synthase